MVLGLVRQHDLGSSGVHSGLIGAARGTMGGVGHPWGKFRVRVHSTKLQHCKLGSEGVMFPMCK